MADHSLSPIVASEHPVAGPSKPKDIELEAGDDDVPLELLERELPFVDHEQIPLRELLQRIMQSIYAELSEMAETYVLLACCDMALTLVPASPGCRMRQGNGLWRTG